MKNIKVKHFILSSLFGYILIFNGVSNLLLGEIFSEGLVIITTISFLITQVSITHILKKTEILIITLILIINFVHLISYEEYYRLLFFYSYILVILLFLNNKDNANNYTYLDDIAKTIVIMGIISSLFAIFQRLHYINFIPLESSDRATGLARSSLNLSGITLIILFVVSLVRIKDNVYLVIAFLLYLGLIAAGGRGAMVCGILIISYRFFKIKKLIYKILIILIFTSFLLIFGTWFTKIISTFNFSSDQSNIERFNAYLRFFVEFNFWGAGIGKASPAVSRFAVGTGFESYILNIIYELGVFGFILFTSGIIMYISKIRSPNRESIKLMVLLLLPIICGQQFLNTPSVFCFFVLSIFFLERKRELT